jgi:S-formylglutathione hydrolase FrmB
MIHLHDRLPTYVALAGLAGAWLIALSFAVRADELPKCPTPGEPCKILLLSPQEEQMLMTKNGILDTAAQARAIDLGQFSVYLKTRIAGAPAGTVTPVPASPPPVPTTQNNSPAPVDNPAK